MNKLQAITDFFIWLVFIGSLIATVILIAFGTYYMVTDTQGRTFYVYGASIITLTIHITMRYLPAGGTQNHKR